MDKKVAGVHLEEGGEKIGVGDFVRVDTIAVAAGAGVDADVSALFGGEACEHPAYDQLLAQCRALSWFREVLLVVEVNKSLQELSTSPRVPRIILRCKTSYVPLSEYAFQSLRLPGGYYTFREIN